MTLNNNHFFTEAENRRKLGAISANNVGIHFRRVSFCLTVFIVLGNYKIPSFSKVPTTKSYDEDYF